MNVKIKPILLQTESEHRVLTLVEWVMFYTIFKGSFEFVLFSLVLCYILDNISILYLIYILLHIYVKWMANNKKNCKVSFGDKWLLH